MATILIVDDRTINRDFLASLLSYFGHVILEASNGLEALALIHKSHPDLVISDVLMPEMDGIELANTLRNSGEFAQIPIIFYTATFRLNDATSMAQACGVTTVIAKPAEPQAILDTVNKVLGSSPSMIGQEELTWKQPPSLLGAPLAKIAEIQHQLLREHRESTRFSIEKDPDLTVPSDILQSFSKVHTVSLRLAAAVELGMELSAQNDPQQLLNLFCRAVREILGIKVAIAWMVNSDGGGDRRAAYGLPSHLESLLESMNPRSGVLAEVLSSNKPRHLYFGPAPEYSLQNQATPDPGISALNRSLGSVSALLVPVGSSACIYGWIYLSNKLNNEHFSEDDQQFASTLATQLAMAYGNLSLLYKVQRKAEELTRSEERFRLAVEAAPNAILMVNPAGRIEMINEQATQLFGYTRTELLGRQVETLVPARFRANHDGLRSAFFADPISRPMATGRDLYGLHREGRELPIEIRLSPIETEAGLMVLSSIVDISDRKQKEAQIQANLREKEILLAEVNHRVRNNLQIVLSLLDLEYIRCESPPTREILLENLNRVNAMAIIHRLTDQSTELGHINFAEVLELLVPAVAASHGLNASKITLSILSENVFLSIGTATPCSMIANEFISNALKNMRPADEISNICVELSMPEPNRVLLVVRDHCAGQSIESSAGEKGLLGEQLVALLASQINGTYSMRSLDASQLTLSFSP